jgi:hypothetical protein
MLGGQEIASLLFMGTLFALASAVIESGETGADDEDEKATRQYKGNSC